MRIKKILLSFLPVFFFTIAAFSQVTVNFTVQGDSSKFYPVTFYDGGWDSNSSTTMEIGRSSVHKVFGDWWGSTMIKVRFHVTNYGNGSDFIDVDLHHKTRLPGELPFVAGWADITSLNNDHKIMIWLRGNTPYTCKSDYTVTPTVYDGVANAISYSEPNGPVHTFKTATDAYVNPQGMTYSNAAFFNGTGVNYIASSLGIGTKTTGTSKLAVEGTIAARRIKVTQASPWPDFVFDSSYRLPALKEVENYVAINKHLPDVPSAADVKKDGLDVGDMSKVFLQKIEEQTLYLIDLKKENEKQQVLIDQLTKMVQQLQNEKK